VALVESPQFDRTRCSALATERHAHCGTEPQVTLRWCLGLGRLAEAAGCVVQAQRSFDCTVHSPASCHDAACCDARDAGCDDINTGLENCLRGYCQGHAGNPDCNLMSQARETPVIDRSHCVALAAKRHAHCGVDEQAAVDQCLELARLSEVAGCQVQADRSFACGGRSMEACSDKACCTKAIGTCDDIDTALDHCLRGYCGSHASNPDCSSVPAN